ncbi:MAG: glycosyltransferase [Candidatus Binatia bacterium]|nr:glycosyltransferase [Candidatus Binatia bacterium]
MTEALRIDGWDARLFAGSDSSDHGAQGLPAARRFLASKHPVTIYHCGARWDEGMALLERATGPVVVRDHNVTPPEFFSGVSDEFVDAAGQGIAQRRRLARDRRIAGFLAASPRNSDDLCQAGAAPERVRIVPPFHRAHEMTDLVPDEDAIRRWQRRPSVLFVGRIAPHKGHRRLLRIAAVYRELYGRPLPLRIVGGADPRLHRWTGRVELDRARGADPDCVEFCGTVSQAELKAAYLTASLFLCCSEHEGFCVPLIEATQFGVPIVATQEPGVATTLGESGMVIDDADEVVAAAVHRVLEDATLRERLVTAQRERVADSFSEGAIRTSLRRALAEI